MSGKVIRFPKLKGGAVVESNPDAPIRMSTICRKLREVGAGAAADELERDLKTIGPWCQGCDRALLDPVIGITSGGGLGPEKWIAFACPWCSSPEVLAQWEREAPPEESPKA